MAETPDATIPLKAERVGNMWTISAVPDDGFAPVVLGAGSSGSGVMFPTVLLDQLVAKVWEV